MNRLLLFLTSFLALWLGGAHSAWAQDAVTPSGFWDANEYKGTAFSEGNYNAATKTLNISSPAELALFANYAYDVDMAGYEGYSTGYEGWTINLMCNLDMSAHFWKPAKFITEFRGIFNGNGFTISGLHLDANQIGTDTKTDLARMPRNGYGLFAEVGGTVQDLIIDKSSFYLKQTTVSTRTGNYLGAICGKLQNGGCLRNCKVGLDTTVEGVGYIGGLVGLVGTGQVDEALTTIVGCLSSATVKGHSAVGGIAGEVFGNASVRYSLYGGGGVTVTGSTGGQIIGNNRSTVEGENKVEKNYYTNDSSTPLNADDRLAYSVSYKASNTGETDGDWLELAFGPSIEYATSGITAYEHILKIGGKYYAGKDENVIFGLSIQNTDKGTYITNVRVNGDLPRKESAVKYSFTMAAQDATVTAALLADNSWDQFPAESFSMIVTEDKVITITTAEELGLLAHNVNSGLNNYEGWTIKLSEPSNFTDGQLSLAGHGWVPIGTVQNPFRGTFDGQGTGIRSLITADSYTFKDYCGLFGYVYNGTIKGVKLYNSIIQGKDYVGGIVGQLRGSSSMVTDCYVDESCNIVATGEYAGGIAGIARIDTKVIGNQCAAPISGVKRVGGIVGQVDSKTMIKDNFYTGIKGYVNASGAEDNGWVSYTIGNINATELTKERNFSLGARIETTINDQDNPAYTVSCDNSDVNMSLAAAVAGEPIAEYTISGITAYENVNFLMLDNKPYFKKGTSVNISLTPKTTGETLDNVTANSGTLTKKTGDNSDYTLTLDKEDQTDVVISATVGGQLWTKYADVEGFSKKDDTNKIIEITTPEQLALLAMNVNSGTTYESWTINLLNDINLQQHVVNETTTVNPEWVPIGNYQHSFAGKFNGNGHTISNLTISESNARAYTGLFGYANTDNASIKNVKLANSTINGKSYTGGIVGTLGGRAIVEYCVVESTVAVKGSSYVGGIVGQTATNAATVNGCVSAATVTGDGNNVGGIVGENNGAVSYSIYNGTTVTGARNVAACIGRIVTFNTTGTYYTNPDYVSQNSFDKRAYKLSSNTADLTISLGTAAKEFNTSSLTYYEKESKLNGFKLGDQLYVGANTTVNIDVAHSTEDVWAIKANDDGTLLKYNGTGYNLTNQDGRGTFTLVINGTDYVLTAVKAADNFEGAGDEDVPYLIRNEQELLQLALAVNKANSTYKDKVFRLENDLDYTNLDATRFQPIGTSDYPFMGTFDGNGHTIKGIKCDKSEGTDYQFLGIFGYITYGTVKHLKVTDSTFKGTTKSNATSYVGGIVGYCQGNPAQETTILNCQVDETVTVSGKYAAGIAGWVGDVEDHTYSIKANVEGCVSAAQVTATICAGGVIGWMRGKELQVKNCLYTGNSVTLGEATVTQYRAYGVANYNTDGIKSLDIYYTQNLTSINGSDKRAYEIKPSAECDVYFQDVKKEGKTAGLLIEFAEPTTAYSLTGIQGYKVGLSYDGHFYATSDQTAKFTLKADNGGQLSEVTATPAATITETDGVYSLTLGASDYTISAKVNIDWSGSGTEDDPYIIDDIDKMNLLSSRAAAGNTYEGNYFKLDADLDYSGVTGTADSNFTPIATFSGKFDGNGHTISGIKISSSADYANVAIFSDLYFGGRVDNLTLTNSTISSNGDFCYVGGIVGYLHGDMYIAGASTAVTNCFVADDVTVSGGNACAGGLVAFIGEGYNLEVEGNISKAKVSNTSANRGAGGILGAVGQNRNGTVRYNLYLGDASSVTSTNGGDAHAIIGRRSSTAGAVYNNFFTAAYTANGNESLAYVYDDQTYSGTAIDLPRITKITVYDKNLMKYGDKFYSCYQKGDANGDGVVNITDNVAVVEYIHGKTEGYNAFAADANGDGVVNITDAVRVVEIIHGK